MAEKGLQRKLRAVFSPIQGKIDDFFERFRMGTLLHRCAVRKRHGHSVLSLTQAIFPLPIVCRIFFAGIVFNQDLLYGKDVAEARFD